MQVFHSGTEAFETALRRLAERCEEEYAEEVEISVRGILNEVRRRGDEALLEYTRKWDGIDLAGEGIEVPRDRTVDALEAVNGDSRTALESAAERIRTFHARQLPSSWEFTDEHGNLLGQKVTPLDRVGVYVPGGKAAYPSSVLMNVLPAKVAGVREIFAVTPPGNLRGSPIVLAALRLAGVDRIFQIGGGASGRRPGLRNRDGPPGGQNRRTGQPLRRHGKASRLRQGGYRYDRRPERGAHHHGRPRRPEASRG